MAYILRAQASLPALKVTSRNDIFGEASRGQKNHRNRICVRYHCCRMDHPRGNNLVFLEVALAQLVYLIGFSYAFFFEGFTGLAVTIGSIITLFVVMQATARINWAERCKLAGAQSAALEIKST